MSEFKDFRKESRTAWGVHTGLSLSAEQIQLGAVLRIADATENMASNHAQLIEDRDRYKKWYEAERVNVDRLRRRVAALRGVITKLRRAPQIEVKLPEIVL